MMKNIEIVVTEERTIVVYADTKRFGKHEIMFEGHTFDECFDYIKRNTGMDRVYLQSSFLYEPFTDTAGRTFPCMMDVVP